MPTLSALILAGGHSRRMGTDKALLPLPRNSAPSNPSLSNLAPINLAPSNPVPSGQPLLLQTVQVAQQLTGDVAVVTPWPARYRALLATTDARLIQESPPPLQETRRGVKPSSGPLSGFAYGWQHTTSDWCLLLACDLPYLDAKSLHRWWCWIDSRWGGDASHRGSTNEALPMASLVSSRKGWEPLCGFYHRSCLPSLNRQIATSQRAFQPWLQQLSIARYDALSPHMLFNCNTPAEWRAVTSE